MTGEPGRFLQPARIVHLDEIDSTSDEARRRAQAGERGPLWLVAERQTAGRGRYGRQWQAAQGNFAATYLFDPALDGEDCARLSFAAALAVLDVLDIFLPGRGRLKWPNDVLIDGRKVSGILLETGGFGAGQRPLWLSIGIGINLLHAPQNTPFPACALAALLAQPPRPEDVLDRLATALPARIEIFYSSGFAAIRDAWLARAYGLDQPIHVKLAQRGLYGVFEGLDDGGALLLREDDELHRIRAGEVFFE